MSTVEQMFVDWRPGRFRSLGMLRQSPEELQAKLRIQFSEGYDNLDSLSYAILKTADGKWFTLLRHRGSPAPGTEICVDLGYDVDYCELDEALTAIGIPRADRTWTPD